MTNEGRAHSERLSPRSWRLVAAVLVALLLATLGPELALLLVPLAGGALVRFRMHERCFLTLAVTGAVVGTCIYWLETWVLFRVLDGISVPLLAIAGLVALALAVWARARRDPVAPPALTFPSRAEGTGALVLAVVVAASIYLSSAPLLDFSETMIFHVPLVASMQRGNVPPINFAEPPHALHYHYGQHVLAAGVAAFGRLPAHAALFACNAWFGAVAALYVFILVRRSGSRAAGFLAAILFVGAGTLNWLSAGRFVAPDRTFFELMNPLGHPFATGNIAIGSFAWRVHGNSMAWAMCVALLVIDLLDRASKTRRLELAVAAGVALGLLAPANETLFAAVAGAAALQPLAAWGLRRRFDRWTAAPAVTTVLLGGALVFFTGGVMKTFFLEGSATHGASIRLDLGNLGTVATWNFGGYFTHPPDGRVSIFSLRFLQDVGPMPYLLVPALAFAWHRRDGVLLQLACAATLSLLAGSVLTLTRYPANTFRLVNLCVVLAAIPTGAALASLPALFATRPGRLLARSLVAVVALLFVANWPLFHAGILASSRDTDPLVPPLMGGGRTNPDAVQFLMEHTRFDEGVLSIPFESWSVLGAGQFSPMGSFVGDRSAFAMKSARAVATVDIPSMRDLGVRYLYVELRGAHPFQMRRIVELLDTGELLPVWESADGGSTIFDFGGDSLRAGP